MSTLSNLVKLSKPPGTTAAAPNQTSTPQQPETAIKPTTKGKANTPKATSGQTNKAGAGKTTDANVTGHKRKRANTKDASAAKKTKPTTKGKPGRKKKTEALRNMLPENPPSLNAATHAPDGENEEDEESDDDDDDEVDIGDDERIRMASLLETFTPEQLRRFEHFRRSHLKRSKVKAVMAQITNAKLSDKLLISMGGIAKVFAGEVIELARQEMEKQHERGPVRPRHVRAAFHQLLKAGKIPYCGSGNRLLL